MGEVQQHGARARTRRARGVFATACCLMFGQAVAPAYGLTPPGLAAAVGLDAGTNVIAAQGAPGGPGGERGAAAARSAAALVERRPPALHASPHDLFIAQDVTTTPEDLQYVSYERTYKGLPVIGGDLVVTARSGKPLSVSVAQRSRIDMSVEPRLTPAGAAEIAQGELTVVTEVQSTRLVVQAEVTPARLAWEVVVLGSRGTMPSALHVFVDARTGEVISTRDDITAGDGHGWINGPTPLPLDTTNHGNGTYSMVDPTRPGISCTTPTGNSGPDDVWGDGVATNTETGCADALWAVQRQWEMLDQWLGRNGIDGKGGGFPMLVGLDEHNAFWNGAERWVRIGSNWDGQWLTSVDVVGHEFGHAVDTTTGGMHPETQEFIADAFGALTEWFVNQSNAYDPPDYIVGEEVNFHFLGGPIRYMYRPSLRGHPECYPFDWNPFTPHPASGVGNHWFYLASEGSSPTNGQPPSPTCNGSTVTGIGIQKVGKILYHAMLTGASRMTYVKYRTATLIAANNLFPGCVEFDAIKAAWDAVTVPAQPEDPACGPPTGVIDAYSHNGTDTALVVSAADGVLANDETPTGEALSAVKASDPAHGTLELRNDGSFIYQPGEDFVGEDFFSYRAADSEQVSDAVMVTISVRAGCGGKAPTIVGTAAGERLRGTVGDDVIVGLGGDDFIIGGGGDDTICAGTGDDEVNAGPGADHLDGGSGNDTLRGDTGADGVLGGPGVDLLLGDTGDDVLSGGVGEGDICRGDAGADTADATCESASDVP